MSKITPAVAKPYDTPQDRVRTRFKVTPAVFAVIRDTEGKVLLQRRYQTGYMDGYYDFPSGHLEAGERLQDSVVRETYEEVGVMFKPNAAELFHVNQNSSRDDLPYMNFMFKVETWTGEARICEPHKCDAIGFFAPDKLPKVTPQVRRAVQHLDDTEVSFSYFTEKDFEPVD